MNLQKNVAGIDVSKKELEVVFLVGNTSKSVIRGSRKFANTHNGLAELCAWALKKSRGDKVHFVMEATGVYHEVAAYYFHDNHHDVSVVLPNKVKHFAKSLNIKTKTDKSDARIIARYGMERNPKIWQPVTENLKDLRLLTRERLNCNKQINRLKNQLHALRHAHESFDFVIELKEQQIDQFEKDVLLLENKIRELVDQDPTFATRLAHLETIKGVRFITAITIVCETNGFRDIPSIRQLVSFAGLDVRESQSGSYHGTPRISKKGNSNIRYCLYMPALSALQHNKPLKKLHMRITERNPKIRQKGAVAVMRKLLILCFVLWKKKETYNPEYDWQTQA